MWVLSLVRQERQLLDPADRNDLILNYVRWPASDSYRGFGGFYTTFYSTLHG